MKFVITGKMEIKPKARLFSKEIEAETRKIALERLYSDMGSKHGLRRSKVKVIKVEEVK